jgi:hypothetical protein
MSISNTSLFIFISLQAVNTLTLIVDYTIIKLGYPSISEIAHKNTYISVGLTAIQIINPVSLAIHFYFFEPEPIEIFI